MQTSRMKTAPRLIPLLYGANKVVSEDFWLIDVGVSGGLDQYWRLWGTALHAVGFDPLVKEIERLRAAETSPNISYETAFVICKLRPPLPPSERDDPVATKNNQSFSRSSSLAAIEAMKMDYSRDIYNAGLPLELSERHVSLDDYVAQHDIPFIDFIKIDTDGHDIEVLFGAEKMLTSRRVLGVALEANFHGPLHKAANTFANMDLFLRSHGYSLYDLELYRYSRRELPAPFVYRIPAQTVTGQVQWADALYLRDFSNPNYQAMFSMQPTTPEIMKLACLFELFGLPDCAAELLKQYRQLIDPLYPVNTLLNALVPDESMWKSNYRAYMESFSNDPKAFYPPSSHSDLVS